MAIRRFNYTHRKRLRRRDARVTIYDHEDAPATFDADLELDAYDLPDNARVFVEAQRQTSRMRFDFGTVCKVTPPEDRRLSEFDSLEAVHFRVRVTSMSEPSGMELAEADRIRPRRADEAEDRRIPLISVDRDPDLGQQVYRVDLRDRPTLYINAAVGDWRQVALHPAFVSLVLPELFRTVLVRILHTDEHTDSEDPDDWRSQWLRFATLLPGVPEVPQTDDAGELDPWIEGAVESFCRNQRVLDRFRKHWDAEGT